MTFLSHFLSLSLYLSHPPYLCLCLNTHSEYFYFIHNSLDLLQSPLNLNIAYHSISWPQMTHKTLVHTLIPHQRLLQWSNIHFCLHCLLNLPPNSHFHSHCLVPSCNVYTWTHFPLCFQYLSCSKQCESQSPL